MRLQRAFLLGTAAILLLMALFVPTSRRTAPRRETAAPVRFTRWGLAALYRRSGGTRYSKLKQINTTNVAKLASAWTFAGVGGEETPIVIDGVMYASTSTGVVALDGDTGKEIWRYGAVPAPAGGGRVAAAVGQAHAAEAAAGAAAARRVTRAAPERRTSRRTQHRRRTRRAVAERPRLAGVAYWPGDATHPARILVMVGQRLLALERKHRAARCDIRTSGLRRHRRELGRRAAGLQEHRRPRRQPTAKSRRATARRYASLRRAHAATSSGTSPPSRSRAIRIMRPLAR